MVMLQGTTRSVLVPFFLPFSYWRLSPPQAGPILPPGILVLFREYGCGGPNSKRIVFSQQHLTHKGEITSSHTLSSRVTESPS